MSCCRKIKSIGSERSSEVDKDLVVSETARVDLVKPTLAVIQAIGAQTAEHDFRTRKVPCKVPCVEFAITETNQRGTVRAVAAVICLVSWSMEM